MRGLASGSRGLLTSFASLAKFALPAAMVAGAVFLVKQSLDKVEEGRKREQQDINQRSTESQRISGRTQDASNRLGISAKLLEAYTIQ